MSMAKMDYDALQRLQFRQEEHGCMEVVNTSFSQGKTNFDRQEKKSKKIILIKNDLI